MGTGARVFCREKGLGKHGRSRGGKIGPLKKKKALKARMERVK